MCFCCGLQFFPENEPSVILRFDNSLIGSRADVKLYKQDGSVNHNSCVINSHHCQYSRLWNNVHKIESFSCSTSVAVGGRGAHKKLPLLLQTQHPSNPTVFVSHSLFPTSCPMPTPFHLFLSTCLTSPCPLWKFFFPSWWLRLRCVLRPLTPAEKKRKLSWEKCREMHILMQRRAS